MRVQLRDQDIALNNIHRRRVSAGSRQALPTGLLGLVARYGQPRKKWSVRGEPLG